MKVRELIKRLGDFNQDASVEVVANNQKMPFSLAWEGNYKDKCSTAVIYVDELNKTDNTGEKGSE